MARRTTSPKQRNAELTRQKLLAAGAKLFAEIGYEAATLERLAEGAGVTKAMVRYHFADKNGLYRAVLTETFDHIAAAIEPVRDEDIAPEAKLSLYIGRLAEAIRARPHVGNLLLSDYAAGRMAKDKALTASLLRFFQSTRAILAEGQRTGAFKKLDAHLFHLWLIGSIVFFVCSERFREDIADAPPWKGPAPRFGSFVRLIQNLALRGVRSDN